MRVAPALLFLILFATNTHAQGGGSPSFNDDMVRRVLGLALDNIARARCENAQPCSPATAAEKENPPVTIAEARAIMNRALVSAAAEHCGLDWERRNFAPMMSYWRNDMKKTERQMALVTLLHGIMQGMAKPGVQEVCTVSRRQNVEQALSFRP